MLSEDRKKQVETTRQKHGADHYKNIGRKGGLNNKTKFNSETASAAAKRRWHKDEQEQTNSSEKGE